MASGKTPPGVSEQQTLGLARAGDPVIRPADEIGDQAGVREAQVLQGQGRPCSVDGHDGGAEGLLGGSAGDEGEVGRLLRVGRSEDEAAGVPREVNGLVPVSEGRPRPSDGAAAEVEHQRQPEAGGGGQEVAAGGQIRAGEKARRANAG